MSQKKQPSQNDLILRYITVHGSITAAEAFQAIGCMRLSARIWDLKHMGFNITKKRERKNGKSYDRYFWEEEA